MGSRGMKSKKLDTKKASDSVLVAISKPDISTSTSAELLTKFKDMSREERKQWLEDAPVGTTIPGIMSNSGTSVTVEKRSYYKTIHGGAGSGTRYQQTDWFINGSPDPYFARTLRTILEDKNKYYKISK